MKSLKRIMSLCLCTLLLGVALNGCNTIEGMGEDIEHGADEVEDATD